MATEDALLKELGALSIKPGAHGPASRSLKVDECAPNNVSMNAQTPEEMHALLVMRFGTSELAAILRDEALSNVATDPKDGMPNWFEVAERIEKYWQHEFRTPVLTQIPFSARFHNKPQADPSIKVWQVVGLSPQGWAAVLGTKGDSAKRYLFFRRTTDSRDVPWVQAAGFPPLPAGRHPISMNIDDCVVSMLFGSSHAKPDGTIVNDYSVVWIDLSKPRTDAVQIDLPLGVPNAIHVTANARRILIVHKDGALTIYHPSTKIGYAVVPYLPRAKKDDDDKPSPGTNPMTGEKLEAATQQDGDDAALERHAVALAVHDQCDPDKVALSTRTGWVIHVQVPPAETPVDQAPQSFAANMRWYPMGSDAKLGDLTFKHPSQEPATSLCVRSFPGVTSPTIAQCGWHVTYRCDEAQEVIERTQVVPRYPAYQAPDCGPMNCIAVLGTTIVVHSNSNKLIIGSLVPDLQDPGRDAVRFRSGTHGQDSPLTAPLCPYRSLCVTVRHVYWLVPDGTLLFSTPCSQEEHTKVIEHQRKAKT